jgi:hypothetical protein
VGPAALPDRAAQDRGYRVLEAGVGVGDDQLDALEPPGRQAMQEGQPAPSSAVTTSKLRTSRWPSWFCLREAMTPLWAAVADPYGSVASRRVVLDGAMSKACMAARGYTLDPNGPFAPPPGGEVRAR